MMHAKATILSPAIAVFLTTAIAGAVPARAASGGPVINAVSPSSVIEKPVPQPTITITGSGFLNGFPTPANLPTITFAHQGSKFQFELPPNNIDFSGTTITLLPGQNHFNLLQAPLGSYDVTVTRPDGQSATATGAFSINTQPAPEPGEIKMRIASYWGGPIMGMDLSPDGQTAYIANGRVLRILDISNEANPTSIGSIYLGGVYDVKVRGGYAFVAAQNNYSFCVVDVSDPASPELVWSHNSGTTRSQVELYGDYAYVHAGSIAVFDISDPLNVVSKGTISGTSNAQAFTIAGDRLVTNQGIHDLAANPINPPLISSFSGISSDGSSITASGNYIYIAGGSSLRTIDVSDPAAPILVDAKNEFNQARGIAVENGHLVLIGGGGIPSQGKGVLAFDIATDPTNPNLVAEYNSHAVARFRGVRTSGTRAFVVCDAEGLLILDITNPADPIRLGNYHSPSRLTRMAKNGDHLFALDEWGVTVLDVSDEKRPQVVGSYLLPSIDNIRPSGQNLAFQGDLIYVSAFHMGLEVMDVSDPANPAFAGRFLPPPPNWNNQSAFYALDVHGDVAHIAFHDRVTVSYEPQRYLTVDISDSENIVEIARSPHYFEIGYAPFLLVNGDVAYSTRDTSSFATVFDVSDIQNPVQSPTAPSLSGGWDIALDESGSTLFTVGWEDTRLGLYIWDVSTDAAHPVLLAHINPSTRMYAVDVQNDRAYVIEKDARLQLFDVAVPTKPLELDIVGGRIGNIATSSILVDEPNVFVNSYSPGNATAEVGLVVVNVHGVEPQEPLGDLNGDGAVNVSDLLILLAAWGGCPTGGTPVPPCPADLNGDGVVDVSDLLILFSNWG